MKTCIRIVLGLGLLLLAGCQRKLTEPSSYTEGNVALLRTAMKGDEAAGGGPVAPAAQPTGWATLRGKFTLTGSPPPPTRINIPQNHSDLQICAPGGQPVYANDLVIGPDGGLKNVVVYLFTKYPDGDPLWEHPEVVASKENPPPFDQKNCVFLTHVFTMQSTATLQVLNSDPTGHNTNISGGGGARPNNFTVPAGGSATYSPGGESSEPFGVTCNIHPWMAAYGLVRNSPYFVVSNEQGEFELKNLPAGVPLELRIWQEKSRFIPQATITGKHDKFNKGRLQLKLENDEERQLEFVLAASDFGGN